MVTNVTSFGRSGLSDFILQRISAVVLLAYAVCVLGFFISQSTVDHAALKHYFTSLPMQIFSTMALFSLVAHAWIGMWTIGTDYIREHYFGAAALVCRFVYQFACVTALIVYTLWALNIIWRL